MSIAESKLFEEPVAPASNKAKHEDPATERTGVALTAGAEIQVGSLSALMRFHGRIGRGNSGVSLTHDFTSGASARGRGALNKAKEAFSSGIWPGLALTGGIAVIAFLLRNIPGVSAFSPMILAILIGILFHNIIGTPSQAIAGIKFSLRRILRFGIILLGLQLTFEQVGQAGFAGITIIILCVVATFLFTQVAGRFFGVDRKLSQLIAAGTSICGASAVIATNTVTRAPDEDVAYAVACVTVFGSIAMFLYPLLAEPFGLGPHLYGLWTGASVHEVAQVVGAAFQNGEQAGQFGTIAKLSRVIMLAPLVIGLGFIAQYMAKGAGGDSEAKAPMPWFVFGFIALIAFNSVVDIPAETTSVIATATTFMLSMALAAMGLETDFYKLKAKGLRPLVLGLSASLFIAVLSLVLIKLIY